jgi:deazaflavin-dependent oxidoreductase (nitroreductase family)
MARLPLATRMVMRLDVWAVRLTGESFFMWWFGKRSGLAKDPNLKHNRAQALVLVTNGRKSGRRRSVVLPYFTFDGKTFVVGSKGGAADDPDWVRNLRASSTAVVYVKRRPKAISTRFADAHERSSLWPQLIAVAPTYASYQRGTSREIPLVLID